MNTTIEKERILLHRDEVKKTTLLQTFNTITAQLNALYQAWIALQLGDISLRDLVMIDEPDPFIRALIFEQNKDTLGKLPLQRAALLSMIEMPEGTTSFMEAFMPLRNLKYNLNEVPLELFTIESGRVRSKPELLAFIDGLCSTYAHSEDEIASFNACQQIYELLSGLHKKYPHLNLLPPVTSQPTVFAKGMDGQILFSKLSTKNVK